MTSRDRFWTLTAFLVALLVHVILLSPISDWINRLLFSNQDQRTIEIDLEAYTSNDDAIRYKKPIKRLLGDQRTTSNSQDLPGTRVQNPENTMLKASPNEKFPDQASLKMEDQNKANRELAQPYQEAFSKVNPVVSKQGGKNNLQFTMNTYEWSYDFYIENWAVDLQKWWRAPADYRMGKVPEGGSVWLRIEMERDGSLKGYEVLDSEVTNDMELKVIQAVTLSMKRPALPESFPEEFLIINWRFVYPPKGHKISKIGSK